MSLYWKDLGLQILAAFVCSCFFKDWQDAGLRLICTAVVIMAWVCFFNIKFNNN